ncbi:MAG: response regulator [Xenococcaceae cyanobacterium MO_234.B1]|nr:response regulator [Xenococcaceae cyanobacterium MO_234.B1]
MNDSSFTSPNELLETKSQQGWSGCCIISEPQDASAGWQIYLHEGKLQYATSNVGQRPRLSCLWQQFSFNFPLPKIEQETSDYEQIYQWVSENQVSAVDAQQILRQLSQEALTQILSLGKARIRLSDTKLPGKVISHFSWQSLIDRPQIESWQKVKNYIKSPLSRLYLPQNNAFSFYKFWKNLTQNNAQFAEIASSQKISDWVNPLFGKVNLYELADLFAIQVLDLAGYLQFFIQGNIIEILPFNETKISSHPSAVTTRSLNTQPIKSDNKSEIKSAEPSLPIENNSSEASSVIACIDDSKTVQKQVTMILQASGYKVINITDASTALRNLSRQQPMLILMDINMPEINGYDLCSMLRRSQKFKEVPIIMLTGRDGIIDRMRAKIVGANNYLTKPFEPEKLLNVVKENVSVLTSS